MLRRSLLFVVLASCFAIISSCGESSLKGQLAVPDEGFVGDRQQGQRLYRRACQSCHGLDASGSKQGPPLVHKVYEPGHHADLSFYMAVSKGTRAHHWTFGDMPPIPGISPDEVGHIITYVRDLQRRAGIF